MKLLSIVVFIFLFQTVTVVFAFEAAQYKANDLDKLLATPKIKSGIKMVVPQKLTFRAVLASPAQNCSADILKKTMIMQGTKKEVVDKMAISKCIGVRSAKGQDASLFILDQLVERLASEISPGEVIEVFADYLYIGSSGPVFLVKEFKNNNMSDRRRLSVRKNASTAN